jgi:hypothetical protein
MQTDADRVISDILHADERLLTEIGRLTLLFSRIEDYLVHHAVELAQIGNDKELQQAATATRLAQLRTLEKRDFLKRVVAEIGRFYRVDHSRVCRNLDEFGNINRLRRSVVHGWIRWSELDKKPVLVDSHDQSVPAWPRDVADLNLKVLQWLQSYHSGLGALMLDVQRAYEAFAGTLLQRANLPPAVKVFLERLKISEGQSSEQS